MSFDRPYPQTWASGAADFVGNELPLLFHLESLGLDLTYWTDVDLHVAAPAPRRTTAASSAWATTSTGPSPCARARRRPTRAASTWPSSGPTPCYRQIRMEPTSVGPNRLQVCYKDAAEDPLAREEPSLTTVNWDQSPVNDPESSLIGSMYQSVGAKADMVVTDGSSWFFDGCNLSDGHTFPNVDPRRVRPLRARRFPGPRNVDVLAHSPVPGQSNWSDVTYYTAPGQRWRRAGQRLGQLRLAPLDDGRHPVPSSSPAPSRA